MSDYSILWSTPIEGALFYQGAWNPSVPQWAPIPTDAYILSRVWRQPLVTLMRHHKQ